jgi:DDE superfamily endonuclease
MPKLDPFEESRLAEAVAALKKNPNQKLTVVARHFLVGYDKLKRRVKGKPSQATKGGHNKRLNANQEDGLKRYLSYLIRIGANPGQRKLRHAADRILIASGDTGLGVSKSWAKRWMTRNKDWFHTVRAKTLEQARKAIQNKDDILNHFADFQATLAEYGVVMEDVWNMDESGFRIGCLNGRIVITHANTKAVYLADPDVRDWVTTIETISAGGERIPAMLILAGQTHLEKFFANDLEDDTLLGVTTTGYSNDLMGLEYIEHFNKMTEKKRVGEWRMLVFDGHGSHMSDAFTWYCWKHNIIPFRLIPHSTHLLQPLDIGIFQPLKHWHQVAIENKIEFGDLEFTKVDFLMAYQTMANRTFKSKTILSAWKKAGLLPLDPQVVIDKLREFQPDQLIPLETPMTPQKAAKGYCIGGATLLPFQTTPTTGNREAHRYYLNMRLMDHFDLDIPLSPSYQRSLRAYQRAVEPRVLEASAIKHREEARLKEIADKKANKLATSGRHVQKSGVIYAGNGRSQIEAREKQFLELEKSRKEVVNMATKRKVAETEKQYKKWLKLLQRNFGEWNKDIRTRQLVLKQVVVGRFSLNTT